MHLKYFTLVEDFSFLLINFMETVWVKLKFKIYENLPLKFNFYIWTFEWFNTHHETELNSRNYCNISQLKIHNINQNKCYYRSYYETWKAMSNEHENNWVSQIFSHYWDFSDGNSLSFVLIMSDKRDYWLFGVIFDLIIFIGKSFNRQTMWRTMLL